MGKTILLAEDDRDIRSIITLILERAGYQVLIYKDASFVNQIDTDNLPALFIFDRWLSSTDSLSICKYLKSQKDILHIPVLIISADPTTKTLYKSAGANAFLEKPFDIQPFLNQVEVLLYGNTTCISK